MIIKFILPALLAASLNAHGGQYRGPGDVVPPGPGGGGNTGRPSGPTTGGPSGPGGRTGGPTGPATGGPSSPTTGGPTGPVGPTTGGRGGIRLSDDLTNWSFWWEFNKDPFIRLRESVLRGGPTTGSDDFYLGNTRKSNSRNSLKPSRRDIQEDILPSLKKAIDSTEQRDIVSACMIAMAKAGQNHSEFKLADVFKKRLDSNNQEIRETAALSLGIAGLAGEEEMDILIQLALGKKPK